MPRASAMRATTCRARFWCTRSSPPATAGGRSTHRPARFRRLLPPPVIAGYQPAMGAVPGLGQHTDSVLAELGIADDEIDALRAQGAIGPVYR